MKKIAVIISGCGYQDGAEITESVSTLIALSQLGAEYKVFAPATLMKEADKISRDRTEDLSKLNVAEFDGLAMPGGYGVAKHLCDWAAKGSACTVDSTVQKVVESFYKEQKPILAICIAPALIAKVLGKHSITVTIGNDKETSAEIEKTGAQHENCKVDDYVTDREHKIITTPAYMYDNAKPSEVFRGVSSAAKEFFEMA